jgi:hypothetical protein
MLPKLHLSPVNLQLLAQDFLSTLEFVLLSALQPCLIKLPFVICRLHNDSFTGIRQLEWGLVALAMLHAIATHHVDLASALKTVLATELIDKRLHGHPLLPEMPAVFTALPTVPSEE